MAGGNADNHSDYPSSTGQPRSAKPWSRLAQTCVSPIFNMAVGGQTNRYVAELPRRTLWRCRQAELSAGANQCLIRWSRRRRRHEPQFAVPGRGSVARADRAPRRKFQRIIHSALYLSTAPAWSGAGPNRPPGAPQRLRNLELGMSGLSSPDVGIGYAGLFLIAVSFHPHQ